MAPQPSAIGALSVRTKLSFGFGQGVESAVTITANTFLLFFLTSFCGLEPSLAGTLLLISLLVDAVADPLIGSWSDRVQSRWGRRLPFMVFSLPLIFLSTLGLFGLGNAANALQIAVVLLLNIVLRVGTSLFAMPYSALTAELSPDYHERSSLMVYRAMFAFIGSVIVVIPAFHFIFVEKASYASRSSYIFLALLLAFAAVVFGGVSVAGLWRRISCRTFTAMEVAPKGLSANARDIVRNPSFVTLFIVCLLVLIGTGVLNALNLYVFSQFWKLPASQNQVPIVAFQAGFLVGLPVTAIALRIWEKRTVVAGALATITISIALPPVVVVLAGLPLPGLAATSLLAASNALSGLSTLACFVAFQSMMADAIDEHELRFGQRCEGLYYSAIVFANKAATGLGSLAAGLILSSVGLHGSTTVQESIGPAMALRLGMIAGPGLAFVYLLSFIVLFSYKLDFASHRRVLEDLALKRVSASS